MKKNINKKILYFLTLCILILIPLTQHISYFLQINNYIYDYKDINPAIILYCAIPFLLILYIINLKKKNFKFDIYDYLLFILIVVGLIVCFNSIHIYTSFFGRSNRHDGFLSLLSYSLLFINWKQIANKQDLKNWYKIIIYISVFNVIYSLLQVYSSYSFIVRTSANMTASGFCGHNNFFGSLVVTALGMVSCKFLFDIKNNFKDIIVIIILFVGLVNSQSSGPFLSYIITLIFLAMFLKKKNFLIAKKLLILIIIFVSSILSVNFINKYVFESEVCELCNIKANVIDNGGHDRWKIWKRTFLVIKKNAILGVGYDNLAYIYPNPYPNVKVDPSGIVITNKKPNEKYYLVDNAHNVYLQTLVSSGIVGLIPYLLLCLFTFVKGCKSNNKTFFIFFAGFVVYSVQAFFNISVISVAPIYYLIIGLILSDKKEIMDIKNGMEIK